MGLITALDCGCCQPASVQYGHCSLCCQFPQAWQVILGSPKFDGPACTFGPFLCPTPDYPYDTLVCNGVGVSCILFHDFASNCAWAGFIGAVPSPGPGYGASARLVHCPPPPNINEPNCFGLPGGDFFVLTIIANWQYQQGPPPFYGVGNAVFVYTAPTSSWNCAGPNTLNLLLTSPNMPAGTTWPTSVQVVPYQNAYYQNVCCDLCPLPFLHATFNAPRCPCLNGQSLALPRQSNPRYWGPATLCGYSFLADLDFGAFLGTPACFALRFTATSPTGESFAAMLPLQQSCYPAFLAKGPIGLPNAANPGQCDGQDLSVIVTN